MPLTTLLLAIALQADAVSPWSVPLQHAPAPSDLCPRQDPKVRYPGPKGCWRLMRDGQGRTFAYRPGYLYQVDGPAMPYQETSYRRECLTSAGQVRVSEQYDTWFRTAELEDREDLPSCGLGPRVKMPVVPKGTQPPR